MSIFKTEKWGMELLKLDGTTPSFSLADRMRLRLTDTLEYSPNFDL